MKVKSEKIPKTAGVENALPRIDYADTFSTTNHRDQIEKVVLLIFGTAPKWVEFLFRLRNKIVRAFGLKTEIPVNNVEGVKPGGNIGFFEIFSVCENEIMLGANDKHLNFRVSIYNSKEDMHNIKVTTLVQYHNRFGKIYMSIVKPGHYFVVRSMVKQAYNN